MAAPKANSAEQVPDSGGVRTLRRFHEGVVVMQERRSDVKFIVEAATGRVVMPAEPGMAQAAELVLFMPEESGWIAHAALEPALIERPEAEEAVDRWAAYHGRVNHSAWIRCTVEGLKTRERADAIGGAGGVYSGDAVMLPNTLGVKEFGLIKRLNGASEALARACKVHGAMDVSEPLAVGVDPFGVDVRARFGIVRLEFPEGVEARTPEQAGKAVEWLLGSGKRVPEATSEGRT